LTPTPGKYAPEKFFESKSMCEYKYPNTVRNVYQLKE
jgi:hypothetical protein